jgi:hypothetical protein
VHLAKYGDDRYVVALIYPAEYNDELSSWLLKSRYRTSGAVQGGIEVVTRYYDDKPEILDRHQLFAEPQTASRTGRELLAGLKMAVQR